MMLYIFSLTQIHILLSAFPIRGRHSRYSISNWHRFIWCCKTCQYFSLTLHSLEACGVYTKRARRSGMVIETAYETVRVFQANNNNIIDDNLTQLSCDAVISQYFSLTHVYFGEEWFYVDHNDAPLQSRHSIRYSSFCTTSRLADTSLWTTGIVDKKHDVDAVQLKQLHDEAAITDRIESHALHVIGRQRSVVGRPNVKQCLEKLLVQLQEEPTNEQKRRFD